MQWVGALWVPGLPEVQPGPEALSQPLGSFPPRPLPLLGLPLDWCVWSVACLDPLEDLRSDLEVWSQVGFFPLEDDLFRQPAWWAGGSHHKTAEGIPCISSCSCLSP